MEAFKGGIGARVKDVVSENAARQGLKKGLLISKVNGRNTTLMNVHQIHNLLNKVKLPIVIKFVKVTIL